MDHLLLVEDDKVIGESLQDAFEEYGYQVTWIQHGEVAQQALKAHSFDLVILDLVLPQISGLEILQSLRIDDKITPVIIITANNFPDERKQCIVAGANNFIGKPFELDDLINNIEILLLARDD